VHTAGSPEMSLSETGPAECRRTGAVLRVRVDDVDLGIAAGVDRLVGAENIVALWRTTTSTPDRSRKSQGRFPGQRDGEVADPGLAATADGTPHKANAATIPSSRSINLRIGPPIGPLRCAHKAPLRQQRPVAS
jgi:hypothetical protein